MKRLSLSVAAFILISTSSYANDLSVDLRFEPTPSANFTSGLTSATGMLRPVRIHAFIDSRPQGGTSLGKLRFNGELQKLQAKTPVANYATEAFRRLFGEWGGKVSLDAPLVLKGEITEFEVEDVEGYQAKVSIHFFLNDDAGKVLWDGHCAGIVKGTGKTVTPENYSPVFSDVLRETYAQLLTDEKLTGVWSGRVNNTIIISESTSPESLAIIKKTSP